MAGLIDQYLREFDRHSGGDPAFRDLRDEVEDHLRCAAEADPAQEAAAIARFGRPDALLSPIAAAALAGQAERTWRVAAAALAASFLAMRLRTLWLGPEGVADLAHALDRYGFVAALLLALAAWAAFGRAWSGWSTRLAGLSLVALALATLAGSARVMGGAPGLPPAHVLGSLGVELGLTALLAREAWRLARWQRASARLSIQ
ncbi:hypothetical protein [Zavarzinia sp. CC-PAN008]|uniref:hypothetical protein n=1 Tax=Zavarzinia sp. CC-PAN008 TaxID=3243332 RepID=UPI003F7457B1